MIRSEARARVRIYIDELQEKRWKNTSIDNLLNELSNEVAALILSLDESYYAKTATFSLQPTQELYNLPDDLLRIKRIKDTNSEPVTRILLSKLWDHEDRAYTDRYYFSGNQIGFRKVPAGAASYPYLYLRTPTPMTDDDNSPDVPAYLCHDLICVKTAIDLLDLDEEMDTYLIRKKRDLEEQIKGIYYRRNTDDAEQTASDLLLDDLEV